MIKDQQKRHLCPRSMGVSLLNRRKQSPSYPSMAFRELATLAIMAILIFLLVSCGSSDADPLVGTDWELASLSESSLLQGTTITIEFAENEVSGLAGCNRYGGSYQTSGSSLTFSDLFQTEMACLEPEGILEQEGAYLAALNVAASYRLTDDQLEILDKADGQLLMFVSQTSGSISQPDALPEQVNEVEAVITHNASPSPGGEPAPTPDTEPTPTPEIVEEIPTAPAVPPPGFKLYEDTTAGLALFLPESWNVTFVDAGRWAILQSYPEDKYVGGEGFQPGDTKCDLNIRPPQTNAVDLIQQWKSNPDTAIVSEQEIVLESGEKGTRLEVENRGHSLSLITEVSDRAIALTCFGDFAPFDDIALSIRAVD